MKRLIMLVALLKLAAIPAWGYEERNLLSRAAAKVDLAGVIQTRQQWVDYPAYSDREGWRALLGPNSAEVIAAGERYLDREWQVVKATDYLDYARTGNRATQEGPHNANIAAVSALFMAEMAEGRGRFMDQLANGVFHLCEMTSWAIAAHMVHQRAKGVLPNKGDHVIELVSGDVGATLSWIYYFLAPEFDRVHPLIAPRLKSEIESRILDTYLNETRFWWMATDVSADKPGLVNNWNVWCNSNVLQCFLLIENDPERLVAGVRKTIESVDKFINYNNEDGACEEGPSYWGHAAGKLYDYLQLLSDATGGAVSIFDEKIVRNMGEYISRSYVGEGWVVNFADASAREKLDYRLIFRFGEAVRSEEMTRFAASLEHQFPARIEGGRDCYRRLADLACDGRIEGVAATHRPTAFTWYPGTQFCYMSEGGWFLAAKGGYNDESHNHNDVGTISLYADQTPVLIDAGVGTYTAKTFSRERYSIWTMQSDYHNLPQINGSMQAFGKQYRARDVVADQSRKTFSVDIAGAYPPQAGVKSWTRSYRLSTQGVEMTDSFRIDGASTPNRLNFLTWGGVDISRPGVVGITVGDKTFRMIYDGDSLAAEVENIELDDRRLSRVWGDRITRISLVAKQIENSGAYTIEVTGDTGSDDFAGESVAFAAAQTERMLDAVGEPTGKNYPRTMNDRAGVVTTGMYDWTPGFFPGQLWYLYELTGDAKWRTRAERWTSTLEPLKTFTGHHDLGFMVYCSFGNAERLAPKAEYGDILVESAGSLATRFSPVTGTIKSWNHRKAWDDVTEWFYPVIIDNMMNLELLFHASRVTGDRKYYDIAVRHADTTLKNHFREDGSSYHVVDYDAATGAVLDRATCQGYSDNSTWARGQAWAIYGYTMVARETGEKRFLDAAVRAADWYLKRLPADLIPLWDFNVGQTDYTPQGKSYAVEFEGRELRDVSAAAVVCSALFELGGLAGRPDYTEAAVKMLRTLASPSYRAAPGENANFLLTHSVGSIPHKTEIDKPLVYADYYFLEALVRYNKFLIQDSKG
jgi:rhamnogalacturonyl hydrolase YesR